MKTAKIEIFKAGRYGDNERRIWNDREVTELVENYDPAYRSAPIILGHNDWNGEKPAYGWVQSLEKNDKGVVVATIEYNDELEELVKQKKYKNVSVEVVKKIELYDLDSDKEGAYLLAVAFLGGSQPAVQGLKPVEFSKEKAEYVASIDFTIDSEPKKQTEEQKEEVKPTTTNVTKQEKQESFKNDTINKNEKGVNMTPEQVEAFKQDLQKEYEAKMAQLDEKFAKLEEKEKELQKQEFEMKRKADIEAFITANKAKFTPALKEKFESFALGLDDKAFEAYKEQFKAMPDINTEALQDEVTGGANESKKGITPEDFAKEAHEDLKAIKGV